MNCGRAWMGQPLDATCQGVELRPSIASVPSITSRTPSQIARRRTPQQMRRLRQQFSSSIPKRPQPPAPIADSPATKIECLNVSQIVDNCLGRSEAKQPIIANSIKNEAGRVVGVHAVRNADIATFFEGLGNTKMRQGRQSEALSLYKRALSARQKCVRESDDALSPIISTISSVMRREGRHEEALSYMQWVVRIKMQNYGPRSSQCASSMVNLGTLLADKGQMVEAETLYRQGLTYLEQAKPGAEYAQALNNLGLLLLRVGKMVEGGNMLEKALSLKEQLWGEDSVETCSSLNNVALYMRKMGQLQVGGMAALYFRCLNKPTGSQTAAGACSAHKGEWDAFGTSYPCIHTTSLSIDGVAIGKSQCRCVSPVSCREASRGILQAAGGLSCI